MNSHTPATSQSWMPTIDTGQSFLIRNPAYSQPSTVPLEDIMLPASSLWPCLFSRHLPEEDGPDPRRVSRVHWECTDDITVHSPTKAEHDADLWNLMHVLPTRYGLVFNPQKNACEGPSCQFLWLFFMMLMVSTLDPDKVNAVYAPTSANKCHQTSGVLTHGNMYLSSFHPWHVHLDCPSV